MKLTVPVGSKDHIDGGERSSVTLIGYGDFECPYCRDAYSVVKQVQRREREKIKFVFRNFPLSEIHPHSLRASCSAEAAGKQGKFWQMHDLLFENQEGLEDGDLIVYAKGLGLNISQFKKDMLSKEIMKKVKEDFAGGVRSGVNGTPTFFINGQRFDGPCEADLLVRAIERAAKNNKEGGSFNEEAEYVD